MRKFLESLKGSKFIKLYISIFLVIVISYLYLVVNRENYINFHSLGDNLPTEHFKYLNNISNINMFLEYSLLFIGVIYVIKIIFLPGKVDLKQFLLMNTVLFIAYGLVGYIVFLSTHAPIGNIMGLLPTYLGIITACIIFSILKLLHNKKINFT